jgi:hypothetical protein
MLGPGKAKRKKKSTRLRAECELKFGGESRADITGTGVEPCCRRMSPTSSPTNAQRAAAQLCLFALGRS